MTEKKYECDCKDFTCSILIMGGEPSGEHCIDAVNGRRCRYLKDVKLMICPDRMSGRTECRLCIHNTPHKDTNYTNLSKVTTCELKSDMKPCILYNSVTELQKEYIIIDKEIGKIIEFTEDMCNTEGWVKEILPFAKKRMDLINVIHSHPYEIEKIMDELVEKFRKPDMDDNQIYFLNGILYVRNYIKELKKDNCHHFYSWSGKIPCTGMWKCSKCGKLEDETSFSGHPTMHR